MECRLNSPLVLKLVADLLDDMVKEVKLGCGTEGDKQNCVTFEFEDPAGDHTADFEMRLQEVDNEELGLPDMAEYEYEVRMPSKMLRDIVSNMKEIGDSLEMTFLANKVVFKAIGE